MLIGFGDCEIRVFHKLFHSVQFTLQGHGINNLTPESF
jgi:hypothetical protein